MLNSNSNCDICISKVNKLLKLNMQKVIPKQQISSPVSSYKVLLSHVNSSERMHYYSSVAT